MYACPDPELTLSTAHTEYSIYGEQQALSAELT